jgi:hypothetical protein
MVEIRHATNCHEDDMPENETSVDRLEQFDESIPLQQIGVR